jgi:shikimate dehydrogenase
MKLALFGSPVENSLSPRIHQMFAEQSGLEIEYQAIEATEGNFRGKVASLAGSGGRGCNVTVPLKRAAWELASRCSEGALRAHAANTMVFYSSSEWFADSTDGKGLVTDLLAIPDCHLQGARICLLGAGGAASSVLGALLHASPEALVVANRTVERADELAENHSDLGAIETCLPVALGSKKPFDVIINATSLGHSGKVPEWSASWLQPNGICYDMNYGQAAEPLRQYCGQENIRYSDGLGMLVEQAALSFGLWTGQVPDSGAVLKQLGAAAG